MYLIALGLHGIMDLDQRLSILLCVSWRKRLPWLSVPQFSASTASGTARGRVGTVGVAV